MATKALAPALGNKVAPWRFLAFLGVMATTLLPARYMLGRFSLGFIASFDVAALVFLVLCFRLLRVKDPKKIQQSAIQNDANRPVLLVITSTVVAALMIAVAEEVIGRSPTMFLRVLVISTLVIAWVFSNIVYALHYAHMAYSQPGDAKGFNFPGTPEPTYSDFVYFACTCGMAFATSDVAITSPEVRKIVFFHSLAAFGYNIGVLAFTVNLLASGTCA